jgi:hypothetical protein
VANPALQQTVPTVQTPSGLFTEQGGVTQMSRLVSQMSGAQNALELAWLTHPVLAQRPATHSSPDTAQTPSV